MPDHFTAHVIASVYIDINVHIDPPRDKTSQTLCVAIALPHDTADVKFYTILLIFCHTAIGLAIESQGVRGGCTTLRYSLG